MLLCLASCKPNVQTIGETIKTADTTWHFPEHTLTSSDGEEDTFTFKSYSLRFKEKSGQLTMNGKDMGTVKPGDTVHINADGKASVDGNVRAAQ